MAEAAVIFFDHAVGDVDSKERVGVAVEDVGDGAGAAGVVEDFD